MGTFRYHFVKYKSSLHNFFIYIIHIIIIIINNNNNNQ